MSKEQITISADERCFVCGTGNPAGLGLTFRIDAERRTAMAETSIDARFQGWQGIVHGGIIAALLDEAAIYACRPLAKEAVTAELNLKFRSPVPTGSALRVEARVIDVRRRLVSVCAKLFLADDRLLAEADAKIVLLPPKTP